MATIEENRAKWNDEYDWPQEGAEWSMHWGSSRMQWYGTILPRIQSFVPADTILEIAPGYGRWTAFLKDLCGQLILVDLSQRCIDACRQRFCDFPHISYYVNDGKSLEVIPDDSVDFIFSFDSLVHAEDDVLWGYTEQFAKKLRPDGVAFIHHSNLGEYAVRIELQNHLSKSPRLYRLLERLGICDNVTDQWRATSMTAAKLAAFAQENGLLCVSQELLTWESNRALVDCLSIVVPRNSKWVRERRLFENPNFWREADYLSSLSHLYEWPSDDQSLLGN